MSLFPTSNLLLKHQPELFQQVLQKKIKPIHIAELFGLSVIGLALFGAVISLVIPNWWHAFNLMWKMLVLIIGSNLLCLPALYVFSSIRGSRLTLPQLMTMLLASIATTAIVLLALAPISWFFTWTTNGELEVIRLLNGLMIGFGILFGLILLARGFRASYLHYKAEDAQSKSGSDILVLWLVLLVIVTVQMSQKLGSWYHLESQVCVVDSCFPRTAEGYFTEAPTVVVSTVGEPTNVVWSIPNVNCNGTKELEYIDDQAVARGQIYGSTADCSVSDGVLHCTAQLPETDTAASGTEFKIQTHNYCDNGDVFNSEIITYRK